LNTEAEEPQGSNHLLRFLVRYPGIALLLLAGAYGLSLWPIFASELAALHGHWTTPNDLDAGYLLLACAGFVLWRTPITSPLASHQSAQLWLFGSSFVICLLLAFLTSMTANKSVTLALLVGAFPLLAGAAFGRATLQGCGYACALLLMATPIWFVLTPPLQELTAGAVNWLFQRGSWPIFIEGNLIALPGGLLEIAAGCAGLKFVQTAIALVLIEGYLSGRRASQLVKLAIAATLLAILSNWLRVAAVTLLALYLGPQHPWVLDHNWVGWLLFALAFGGFFYFLREPSPTTEIDSEGSVTQSSFARIRWWIPLLLLVISGGAAQVLICASAGAANAQLGQRQLAAAQAFCANVQRQHPYPAKFVGAQLTLDCVLNDGSWLSLRGYLREYQAAEVINPANEFVAGLSMADFRLNSTTTKSTSIPVGLLQLDGMVVAIGYGAAGRWTASPGLFKLLSIIRLLRQPLQPGPVFALVLSRANDASTTLATAQRDTQLITQFAQITQAITAAAQDADTGPDTQPVTGQAPAWP